MLAGVVGGPSGNYQQVFEVTPITRRPGEVGRQRRLCPLGPRWFLFHGFRRLRPRRLAQNSAGSLADRRFGPLVW